MKHIYITSLALSDLKDSGRAYVTALPPGEGVISTAYMRVEDAAQAVRETAGDAVAVAIYEVRDDEAHVWFPVSAEYYGMAKPDSRRIKYAAPPARTSADARNAVIEECAKVCEDSSMEAVANGYERYARYSKECADRMRALLAAPIASALPVERP